MADWSALPWPALKEISNRLPFGVDYIRFCSVCTSWRSSVPKRPHLPLLAGHLIQANGTTVDLFSFTGSDINPIHHFPPILLPDRFCCGSSQGWMAFLDPTPSISLWNPITKSQIHLPPLTHYPDINWRERCKVSKVGDDYIFRHGKDYVESFVRNFDQMRKYLANKLVLSSDPYIDPNCVALLIRGRWRKLAFLRLGDDDDWTPVQFREFRNFNTDAILYRGRFHVACRHAIYVLNLSGEEPGLERVPMANPPYDDEPRLPEIDECFLVESAGDLLLVNAFYTPATADTIFTDFRKYVFEVYKVDWGVHRVKMMKLRSLGDQALFLGRNESYSLSASKFPGCRPNCIYMAEYYKPRRSKIRVYNLGDRSTKFVTNYSADPSSDWSPCAWVKPNLGSSNK